MSDRIPAERAKWGTLGEPAPTCCARLVHVVETPVATLRHAFYETGADVPLHRHDRPALVYGVGGPCLEQSRTKAVIKRRLTFHPRGYEHCLHFQGPTDVLAIEIHARGSLGGRGWPEVSTPLPATLYAHVWHTVIAIIEAQPERQVEAALTDLVDGAERFLAATRPAWLMALLDHIHEHWRDIPSTAALAAQAGLSAHYMCRAFKRHCGVTIQQYGVALRLDYARSALWRTGEPISQIALDTGFSDQSHLTRALTSQTGRSPARLRWRAPCLKADRWIETGPGQSLDDRRELPPSRVRA